MTERVQKLRDKAVTIPGICTERARLLTESYRTTESLPPVLRRAAALEHILSHMSIFIDEGELIVGRHTSKVRGGALLPEVNADWILGELDTVSERECEKYQPLTEAEKDEIRAFMPYWEGKSLSQKWEQMVPEEYRALENIVQAGGYCRNCHYPAHISLDYERLLRLGLRATIAELERDRDAIDVTAPDGIARYEFCVAAIRCQKAVLLFAERYAALAEQMAAETADPARRAELERIARTLRRVPAEPAESYYEALQAAWLLCVCAMIECWGAGVSMGRVDQYVYPYYRRDLDRGVLTRAEATELMELLLVKMNDVVALQAGFLQEAFSGYPVMQGLTVGGITADGADAVNELSYVILDAEEQVGLTSEEIVIRIHAANPNAYVERACQVARQLHGKLKFVSDESTIAALVHFGIPEELARQYISCGCHCPMVPGHTLLSSGVIFNFPLMLELALNNGVHRQTGRQIGPRTGDPRSFTCIEDVERAFLEQFRTLVRVSFVFKNADMAQYAREGACSLVSSFYTNCRETHRDIFDMGIYPYGAHVTSVCGVPNVADSLAALQQVVFERGEADMERVLRALESDFRDDQELLHLLERAPRFGNDQDAADRYAVELLDRCSDIVCAHTAFNQMRSAAGCIGMTVNIPFGQIIGALPDGRLAGQPLSEGGISPYQGRNTHGMTATMKSVAKIDHEKILNGSILNIRVSPSSVKDETSLRKFAALVRTFCRIGGSLVQFNFTDNATLRAAQREPEKYRDLLVRVATYSSYFVELSPSLQENIISRNESEL